MSASLYFPHCEYPPAPAWTCGAAWHLTLDPETAAPEFCIPAPDCAVCAGTGLVPLFTSVRPCERCAYSLLMNSLLNVSDLSVGESRMQAAHDLRLSDTEEESQFAHYAREWYKPNETR